MKHQLAIFIAIISIGCDPLSSNEIEGIFELASLEVRSPQGEMAIFFPPQVSGRMSFESNGTYAFQFDFEGSVSSGSGRYTISGGIVILDSVSGGIVILDNQTSGSFDNTEANLSVSYTGQTVTMVVSFSPPLVTFTNSISLNLIASMTIQFVR